MSELSWFSGKCIKCNYPVVVTQPDSMVHPYADYWWYCSNKLCTYHNGEHTVDQDKPRWVDWAEWCRK